MQVFFQGRKVATVHVLNFLSSDHIVSTQLWHFEWETFTDALILFSKVDVLFFESFDFRLDFGDDLIFLIHLDDRFVPNIHSSGCIVECGQGFIKIDGGGTGTCDHKGL